MIELIGYVGMVIALSGVVSANSGPRLRAWYNKLVIVGGICLTFDAIRIGSVPFAILNIVFTCLGIWGLIKERRTK